MVRMVLIYKTPTDTAAFDKHYFGTHVPLAKKLPGLRKFEVSQGPIDTLSGPAGAYLVATMYFDDMTAIEEASTSAEAQALVIELQSSKTDLPYALLFDSREV